MKYFIDTSAFLAIINKEDRFHQPAKRFWQEVLSTTAGFTTTNYVILETIALIQSRFGLEALRRFIGDVLPAIETVWVDEALHQRGISVLMAANRKQLSLVDCTSFDLMRQNGLDQAFSFDSHFQEQGFHLLPE